MTKLSVNINKIATLRNSRGGNVPDLLKAAEAIQEYGAQGITIHPRPDERHIRYQDARDLKTVVYTEFNIEGNPIEKFINLALELHPTQVTLVPDAEHAITSNYGWNTIKHKDFLTEVITELKNNNIRTSVFIDPNPRMVEGAAQIGADRVELYTENYAVAYQKGDKRGIYPYIEAAKTAHELHIGLNAGHDLNLENIWFFKENIPSLLEVSIGHALISEALYLGLENVVNLYLNKLK
jgi:pyridoxine 5-phosphate synthase